MNFAQDIVLSKEFSSVKIPIFQYFGEGFIQSLIYCGGLIGTDKLLGANQTSEAGGGVVDGGRELELLRDGIDLREGFLEALESNPQGRNLVPEGELPTH